MKFRDRPMTASEAAFLKIIDRLARGHKFQCWTSHWTILRDRQGKRIGLIRTLLPMYEQASLADRPAHVLPVQEQRQSAPPSR